MRPIIIIRARKTFPEAKKMFGEFDDFFMQALNIKQYSIEVRDAQTTNNYPCPNKIAGILITGAHEK